ncbi:hypothetical protein [Scleromatobacter humisilvae]|uniref:DUF11 domain-containing protein n=1 Tax=Scleromatobacter humisilvae TaxID=2897159 RepID=A0A9X1YGA8_9BURK|nr:hypothetical protein [Scleromatobacter humisilvae]MCK9684900.1 hypothetical protein [Scleromatobacter humisilvae]
MFVLLAPARPRCRALVAVLVLGAALAGCDGSPSDNRPIPLTITATDANGPLSRGNPAIFVFTVTNPSSSDVTRVTLSTSSVRLADGTSPLATQGVSCTPQNATCPMFDAANTSTSFTLPAGGVLTFTVTTTVTADYDGPVAQGFAASSIDRSGQTGAEAHVTLADAREGYYELFSATGLRDNVVVGLQPGAIKFATAPTQTEHTFVQHPAGDVFPSGALFNAGASILAGQADFGHGPEAFIGMNTPVGDPADYDGKTFTVLGVTRPAGAAAASTVRTMAIAGTTMTVCADATPQTIATCPAASLRAYALTNSGPIFTATDAADNDSFDFQLASSGGGVILLQADQSAAGNVFAVGFADPAVPAAGFSAIGAVAGTLVEGSMTAGSFTLQPIDLQLNPVLPTANASQGAPLPGGLIGGTRASDGAAVMLMQQHGLLVVSGPGGELDVLVDPRVR